MEVITCLAKSYLKSISTRDDFESLLKMLIFTDNEVEVLRRIYLQNERLDIIANKMDYSLQNIKVIHKSALTKVGNYIVSTLPTA